MTRKSVLIFVCIISFLNAFSQENYKNKDSNLIVKDVKAHKTEKVDFDALTTDEKPKNIILLIGDGMGVSQLFSGITANKGELNMQNFKCIGFSKTQSASDYITDSAAGGTAISAGVKTNNGNIGVDENGKPVKTILEYSEESGKATGLVSTSSITHATPASFIAHQPSRSMYEEIALDFLSTDVDVFIGGGRKHFDDRKDGRKLTNELKEKGYTVYENIKDVKRHKDAKLAVLTSEEHNGRQTERGDLLPMATKKALKVLQNDKDGFFLMVEGSQIDWGGHQNNIKYIVEEVLDFDIAIGEALKFAAKNKETLVIVTSDHETSGLGLNGGDIEKGIVKAGFTSTHHTGVMVPVFAVGPGAKEFMGIYENTELFEKMFKLFGLKK